MKKQILILTIITTLALLAGGCNLSVQGVAPEESGQEGLPPEEQMEQEIQPEEEHPPEEPGGAEIILFEAPPAFIGVGGCATLEWGVEGMAEVTLDGELVEQYDTREVCPADTTSYHLIAHSENDQKEREVTVTVEDPGQSGNSGNNSGNSGNNNGNSGNNNGNSGNNNSNGNNPPQGPTPEKLILHITDLALTDLYPDKLKNGTVYARITNHGTDKVIDLQVNYSCKWARYDLISNSDHYESSGDKHITIKTLGPGQTMSFYTGITVDLTKYWYDMTCTIQVPGDMNTGNDSYNEKLK